MRAMANFGLLLVFLSGVAIVQSVREFAFWQAGSARYEESEPTELPIRYAGHTLTVVDSLKHRFTHGTDESLGVAHILLDGREVVPPRGVRIRPALDGTGRYFSWIETYAYRDKRTGERAVLLARRRSRWPWANRSYDLVRIGSDGATSVRRIAYADRAQSYPVWRTVQFLTDVEESAIDGSMLNTLVLPIVPAVYPGLTLVLGCVLIALGRRRRTEIPSSAAAPPA